MIKFFIFLFSIILCAQQAQAQNNISGIERLIQGGVDLESLGLDNIEKPKLEPQKDTPKTNLIDTITKVEEKNIPPLENKKEVEEKNIQSLESKKEVVEKIEKITEKNTIKLPKKIIKKSYKKRPIIKNKSKKIYKKNLKNIDKIEASTISKEDEIDEDDINDSQEIEAQTIPETEPKINTKNKSKKSILRAELERQERISNNAKKQQEKIALNAKKQEEKLKKFDELKNFYLSDLIINDNSQDEDFHDEEKIIPKRKELAPFALEELPPLPILNRSRTSDNFHIPFVYTPKEYIDVMFSAISMGSVSYFNEAFKYVLNPNIKNEQGDTILTYAIFLKKYSIISSVLSKGADPNLPNKLGHTPVSIAIELVDFQALELLEKNNADLQYKDAFGRSYLMHASRVGFLPAVDLLVKNNLYINDMDDDGFTALSIAYRHRKELVVQYLLKNGAKTWIEKSYNPQKRYFMDELNNRWK